MYFSFLFQFKCTGCREIVDIQLGMQREQIDNLDNHLKFSKKSIKIKIKYDGSMQFNVHYILEFVRSTL